MNSHSMELEGLKRTLAKIKEQVPVLALITDRHGSIKKHMEKTEPLVKHYYDSWHLVRSKYSFYLMKIRQTVEEKICLSHNGYRLTSMQILICDQHSLLNEKHQLHLVNLTKDFHVEVKVLDLTP